LRVRLTLIHVDLPVKDKIAFQRRHKFVIAFENQSYPGYLTEKFAEAACSGAIPIYWGDPNIGTYFNPKAFINCHDFPDLQAVAEHVAKVDQNELCFAEYMREPWFRRGRGTYCLPGCNRRRYS